MLKRTAHSGTIAGKVRRQSYDDEFYAMVAATARSSARAVLPRVFDLCKPKSVIDLGCGLGTWLAVARELGVAEILGVDGAHVAPEALEIPRDRFLVHDLSLPLELERRFDLAISLEVAEHLPRECADAFVRTLVGLAPVVLFSAAIPGQGGTLHLNEQWPSYWADKFATHGHRCIDVLRDEFWGNDEVAWWYQQNMLLFVRTGHELPGRLAALPIADRSRCRALVHPTRFEAACRAAQGVSRLTVPEILRQLPSALWRSAQHHIRFRHRGRSR